jgi:hypothetical protein
VDFGRQDPEPVYDLGPQVGQAVDQLAGGVVPGQANHGGAADLPPVDQPELVQLGNQPRGTGAADSCQAGEGRDREFGVDPGQCSQKPPDGSGDHGLDWTPKVHKFTISNVDVSFVDLFDGKLSEESLVQSHRRIAVSLADRLGVDVEGQTRVGMSKSSLDSLDVNACEDQLCRSVRSVIARSWTFTVNDLQLFSSLNVVSTCESPAGDLTLYRL